MTTLVEFLLARIAEDEQIALLLHSSSLAATRPLADCKAKRWIAEEYAKEAHAEDWEDGSERRGSAVALGWVCQVLALTYADHPDYQEPWRP